MKTIAPAPPRLATLRTQPSWHNRAGRVDRSACFVVTASKLWRLIPDDDWRYLRSKPPGNDRGADSVSALTSASDATRGTAAGQARRLTRGRADRVGMISLAAHDLWIMHRLECPHPLRGDYRTSKSNAMRTGRQSKTNPNRGAGFALRHKILGLDPAYETTLTIQRIVQHAQLKQHFLICPVCGLGGQSPSAKRQHVSRGRVTKLFLPLCTEREWEDAQVAHLWLRTHTHPNRPLSPEAAELIHRYAELFQPRRLRCRQCLGLRYGEVKP